MVDRADILNLEIGFLKQACEGLLCLWILEHHQVNGLEDPVAWIDGRVKSGVIVEARLPMVVVLAMRKVRRDNFDGELLSDDIVGSVPP